MFRLNISISRSEVRRKAMGSKVQDELLDVRQRFTTVPRDDFTREL